MLEVGFSTTTGGGPCFCTHFRKAGNYSVMMVNEVRMKGGHVQSHSRADLLPCSHISGTPLAQWMVETTRIDAGSAGAADRWNVSRQSRKFSRSHVMASCLIPTSDLPVTREESHCLSAVDFPEADFWGVCWLSRHIVGENL